MAMLATFQLNEDAIAALTPRMLDMAAAMGTGGDGLTSIALQLGKAFTGQVGALSRSGVLVDNLGVQIARAKGPAQEFSFLIGELDKNFKGLAQQLASTTLGQIDQMENRISDMNERLGQTALPLKEFMTETKMFIMESLARWPLFFEKWKEFAELPIAERWTKSWAEAEAEFIKLEQAANFAAGRTNMTLEQRRNILSDENILDILAQQNDMLKDDGVISFEEQIILLKAQRGHLDATYKEGLIESMDLNKKDLELQNKILQVTHAKNQAEIKAAADLFSNLGRLTGANRSFAIAGARLSQASAIIDMYAGANKAFAQGGVLGFFTGASIIAAGLANIAEIEAALGTMQGAKHGADFVTSGPQMMMVGEGSGPEHVQVTPLVDSNTSGPQGNITVNISAPLIDDTGVDRIVPAIEKAVGRGQSDLVTRDELYHVAEIIA